MGYQNYKWSISYDEGINIAYETIKDVLKENNSIDFNNLIFLLNSRTKL